MKFQWGWVAGAAGVVAVVGGLAYWEEKKAQANAMNSGSTPLPVGSNTTSAPAASSSGTPTTQDFNP